MNLRARAKWTVASTVLFVCSCFAAQRTGQAVSQPTLEYEVKAAFLLNFTRFVEWPANAFADSSSPLTICILGRDPFGGALEEIVKGEAVNSRTLVVRKLNQVPPPQTCQIAYIDTTGRTLSKDLAELGRGVLTVGEGDEFVKAGGIVGFVLDNRRVRFDINRAAAAAAELKLSSRLLGVARQIIGTGAAKQ
jgi:hypothetical protein